MTVPPNDASRDQIIAAIPSNSTWLTANAGSGKTRVLTDRVARLLLEEKVPPQRILCLTYTKAAASEMQNRLFKRLGEWAMMDDAHLSRSLADLGLEASYGADALVEARRLFASAIETPGGLKIQTIHSFCASLLRRFPLEARVSPNFTEIDDRAAKLLREDVLEHIATHHPAQMAGFAAHFTGDDIDAFLAQISRNRELFAKPPSIETLRDIYALRSDDDDAKLLSQVFLGSEAQVIDAVLPALEAGSKTDMALATNLRGVSLDAPSLATLAQLEALFLTGPTAKAPFTVKATPPTKDTVKALGDAFDQFDQLRHRVEAARETRLALAALEKARALHAFATPFLAELDRRKLTRGLLDFDDLILKARALMTDRDVAAWVLFRLDGGIDHILVDEAQDTSPDQWKVIELLTQEFTSGDGARADTKRTMFVVGDKKQSIYSFQGADPRAFDEMKVQFSAALDQASDQLHDRELLYSFRTAEPILRLVDATFTENLRRGMGGALTHLAFKSQMPGRVDLWDWIEKSEKPEDTPWFDPVDRVSPQDHSVLLAEKIAGQIKDQIASGWITRVDGDKTITRRIRAGDFLILVQRRATLFHEIIRACKALDLPMAGADRLRIGAVMAVKDLTALMSYLATPEDDLSLAALLRSPIGGFSEAQLYDLAQGREQKFLSREFERRKDEWPALFDMLEDLRKRADFMRPYDLLEHALTRHKCREKLLARLGPESDEGITALLDQALSYEQNDVPSLTGFLTWLATDEVTIKRQIDSNSDQIRVMTVHGAKGLEAPIVILPDTVTIQNRQRDDILDHHGTPLWKVRSDDMPAAQIALNDQIKVRQAEEKMRLLYVAMTRAENWLIVCGAGEAPKSDSQAWYNVVERGLSHVGAVTGPDGVALRLDDGRWPIEGDEEVEDAASPTPAPLPAWISKPPKPATDQKPISPSSLKGAKALGSPDALDTEQAMARGTAIHALLEHLPAHPRAAWTELAPRLTSGYDGPDKMELLAHATRVLDAPELAHLFEPGSLAEVGISAKLDALGGQAIFGTIDRLIITPDLIQAVDFKTNALVPNTAENTPIGILRQMGAYLDALSQIYPDTPVEIAILWTETTQLMTLRHDIVRKALASAHTS